MMSPYDKQVYDAGFKYVPKSEFLLNPFQIPQDGGGGATAPVQPGLPSINISGGGGGGAAYTGGIRGLTTDFQKAVDARTQRLEDAYDNPSTAKIFGLPAFRQDVNPADAGFYVADPDLRIPQQRTMLGKMFQPQSPQEIMEQGYEPMTNIGILSNILGKADKFGTLPRADQAFITSQMGYSGPTVFGNQGNLDNKDPFGLNTRSAFGNYAERVGVEVDKLSDALSSTGAIGGKKDFQGATFNPATGEFEAAEDSDLTPEQIAALNQRTNLVRTKLNFYRNKVKERDDLRRQEEERIAKEEEEAARVAANARQAAFDQARKDREKYADVEAAISRGDRVDDRDRPSSGPTAVGAGMGVGGGYASDYGFLKDGGRVQYMMGGLADLVDIYD
jgi:hypothetical protein